MPLVAGKPQKQAIAIALNKARSGDVAGALTHIADAFNESKHPRDASGRFGKGSAPTKVVGHGSSAHSLVKHIKSRFGKRIEKPAGGFSTPAQERAFMHQAIEQLGFKKAASVTYPGRTTAGEPESEYHHPEHGQFNVGSFVRAPGNWWRHQAKEKHTATDADILDLARVVDAAFSESDHPRDENGQFKAMHAHAKSKGYRKTKSGPGDDPDTAYYKPSGTGPGWASSKRLTIHKPSGKFHTSEHGSVVHRGQGLGQLVQHLEPTHVTGGSQHWQPDSPDQHVLEGHHRALSAGGFQHKYVVGGKVRSNMLHHYAKGDQRRVLVENKLGRHHVYDPTAGGAE